MGGLLFSMFKKEKNAETTNKKESFGEIINGQYTGVG